MGIRDTVEQDRRNQRSLAGQMGATDAASAQASFNTAYGGQTSQNALDMRDAGTLPVASPSKASEQSVGATTNPNKLPGREQAPSVGTDPQTAGTLAAQMNAAMPGAFNGNPETGVPSKMAEPVGKAWQQDDRSFREQFGQRKPGAWGSFDQDRRAQWKSNNYQPEAAAPLAQKMTMEAPKAMKAPEAGAAKGGDEDWTWKGSSFKKNKQKGRVDPTGAYGAGKSIEGYFDPAFIPGIEDEGTRDLLSKWNDLYQQFEDSQGLGGVKGKRYDRLVDKLRDLQSGLESVGFEVNALPVLGEGEGQPGDSPDEGVGGGANPGGVPDPTRGEVDLGGGLPNIFQSMPTAIRNMFNLGKNPSPEKIAAATSAYMDMWRENKGMAQQQLGVNEMDRALDDIRNNELRTTAEQQALEIAQQGDPTDWEGIKNRLASDYGKSTQQALGGLGSSAARRGISPGAVANISAQLQGQQGDSLARALGELENQQALQGRNVGLQNIDALTGTFGATQTPLTNAQMMLSQALMGQAPYSQQFGSGTDLFDSTTGLKSIEIAERAADEANDVSTMDKISQGVDLGANAFKVLFPMGL